MAVQTRRYHVGKAGQQEVDHGQRDKLLDGGDE
jgi:hypothetical protein